VPSAKPSARAASPDPRTPAKLTGAPFARWCTCGRYPTVRLALLDGDVLLAILRGASQMGARSEEMRERATAEFAHGEHRSVVMRYYDTDEDRGDGDDLWAAAWSLTD